MHCIETNDARGDRGKQVQRGFTVLEAKIMVSVIAVSTATAVSGFKGFLERKHTEALAADLASDLQFVRSEAVSRNASLRVSFMNDASGASCYVIHTGSVADCHCGAEGPAVCQSDSIALKTVHFPLSRPVRVNSNVRSMLFDPKHGTVSPTGRIVVEDSAGRQIHHVVNLMGRVRTCTPAGTGNNARTC